MINKKPVSTINVIPFIDIMLVLLVMVLVTATFVKTGLIGVDLPEAKGESKEHNNKEFKLTIQKDGTLLGSDKKQLTIGEFEAAVMAGGKDMSVVIYSDKEAAFDNFVGVMEVLKRLDHEQLYIVTDKK